MLPLLVAPQPPVSDHRAISILDIENRNHLLLHAPQFMATGRRLAPAQSASDAWLPVRSSRGGRLRLPIVRDEPSSGRSTKVDPPRCARLALGWRRRLAEGAVDMSLPRRRGDRMAVHVRESAPIRRRTPSHHWPCLRREVGRGGPRVLLIDRRKPGECRLYGRRASDRRSGQRG
jgi:hypothetical protein